MIRRLFVFLGAKRVPLAALSMLAFAACSDGSLGADVPDAGGDIHLGGDLSGDLATTPGGDSGADDTTTPSDATPPFAAGQPRLLFSDMVSGVKAGWSSAEPGRGCAITVWGYGLGATRGDSYITVGGRTLEDNADYAVWGEAWPTPFWTRITFWLNEQMSDGETEIKVTVDGKTSNAIKFSIRAGRIFFVAASGADGSGSLNQPFVYTQAANDIVDQMQPGDIYYFRAGTYDSKVNGGNSVLWIRDSEPSGTASQPISFIAYPGERPRFSVATYDVNFHTGIQLSNHHMVFAGFEFDSEWKAVALDGDYHRLVGNDLVGLKDKYGSGTGTLKTGGGGAKILGNAIHGGRSKDRFDHATYFGGCADVEGNHLGWNYVYDNDFGRGPELAINHQENRCAPGTQILKAHFVFNNIVDCSPQRAVALNVYDLSYDSGEPEPEPTYVYNNLFMNCGTLDPSDTNNIGWAPTLIANSAHSRFYNNVLYNSGYVGFKVAGGILSAQFRNNIVVMNSSLPLDGRDHAYVANEAPAKSTISNNLFFELGTSGVDATGVDTANNQIDKDPLFADPQSLDFSLLTGSPAIDAGANDLLFEVAPPDYAPIERDISNALRQGGFDLGILEYYP